MPDPADVPVFLLCGGLGTRLREETDFRPKPMVPVGPRPILWHIMKSYARHGFRRFILCLGYKGEMIRHYFLNYAAMNSDLTVSLGTNGVDFHGIDHGEDWDVTLVDTGERTMTGARVAKAAERFLGDAEHFAVTYGDGLTDADLAGELAFHERTGLTGTILGVHPPSRFGELKTEGDAVVRFAEKPAFDDRWINGGYLFFHRSFLGYLSHEESCTLEAEPLAALARAKQMAIYRHEGFWHAMDTARDRDALNRIWAEGGRPWLGEGTA